MFSLESWNSQEIHSWGEIFATDETNKGLITKLYKQLIQLDTKNKKTTQLKNGQKTLFLQRRHTDDQ